MEWESAIKRIAIAIGRRSAIKGTAEKKGDVQHRSHLMTARAEGFAAHLQSRGWRSWLDV